MITDLSSTASCRILIVSQSLDTSRDLALRIKSIPPPTTLNDSNNTDHDSSSADTLESDIIPWTIRNKYYTAEVHFQPVHLSLLPSLDLDDIPAVIYAWKENDPYETHLKTVSEHLEESEHDPEVLLAIGLSPLPPDASEESFFKHAFEYVDGHSSVAVQSISESLDSDTPGLHRAVDALSTIMWPSMVRGSDSTKHTRTDTAGPDEVDTDFAALLAAADLGTGGSGMTVRQREMAALERWLEEDTLADEMDDMDDTEGAEMEALGYANITDDSDHHDILESPEGEKVIDDAWIASGTSVTTSKPHDTTTSSASGTVGFDDDFTDFISAPSSAPHLLSSPLPQNTTNRSNPTDLKVDADSDPDLPSSADIRASTARIFGSEFINSNENSSKAHEGAERRDIYESSDDPVFDLTRVFSALENIKAEIASMPDERARRSAAAKAALGLVYGLELEGAADDFDFNDDDVGFPKIQESKGA